MKRKRSPVHRCKLPCPLELTTLLTLLTYRSRFERRETQWSILRTEAHTIHKACDSLPFSPLSAPTYCFLVPVDTTRTQKQGFNRCLCPAGSVLKHPKVGCIRLWVWVDSWLPRKNSRFHWVLRTVDTDAQRISEEVKQHIRE